MGIISNYLGYRNDDIRSLVNADPPSNSPTQISLTGLTDEILSLKTDPSIRVQSLGPVVTKSRSRKSA